MSIIQVEQEITFSIKCKECGTYATCTTVSHDTPQIRKEINAKYREMGWYIGKGDNNLCPLHNLKHQIINKEEQKQRKGRTYAERYGYDIPYGKSKIRH